MKAITSLGMAAAVLVVVCGSANAQSAQPPAAPPRDLPYVAVHNPEFISASQATFLQPEDRVIGVVEGEIAKAFPAAILSQHGLVQDEAPGGPIAVTW
jgi:Protein of unknown function (DUF3179)